MPKVEIPLKLLDNQKNVIKDIRNYMAGRAEGFSRDESLLEELLKCTFAFYFLKKEGMKQISSKDSAEKIAKIYHKAFSGICKKNEDLFHDFKQILISPSNIKFIHNSLLKISKIKNNKDDLIGDMYEVFIGNSHRGQEGQYFTPHVAVNALISIIEPKLTDIIIDPACGAGGFLYESIIHMGSDKALPSNIHGIDKDSYLARLAKLRLTILFSDDFHIHSADSLTWNSPIFKKTETSELLGKYDLCLTNPPFGKRIVSLSERDKNKFELAHKWKYNIISDNFTKTDTISKNTAPQILFVERALSLVKEGGKIGIVLPESMISNTNTRYVVNFILNHATPIAVIGMPEDLFKISGKGGTHTKVCLLVIRKEKRKENESPEIFMAEAKRCGHDSRGKKIPLNDIPEIIEKYKKYKKDNLINHECLGFTIKLKDIRNYVLAPRYYNPENLNLLDNLKNTHHMFKIGDLVSRNILEIKTGDEIGKLSYGTGEIPFIRTSDISNWEIKSDPKHLVSEDTYRNYSEKQDVREGDILMVRDGTYLIGTSAMVTSYDTKILYQSHLLKIRVKPNSYFDNYLFLAALSSNPVRKQIKSFSFTIDIIDSLGDRIKDVIIPIPKNKKINKKISETVKKSINDRIEARELAKIAREEIISLTI